ncbi:hypothetical protein DI272_18735 [Streptomyces sp. Act143]|uniref:hypothetical protein n=1 Tax=Streptomyces sp. Act143 TaxID=2200760 RepID=UPI000D67DB4B|nr:hypothetical protein [Streptomyces sp. Act143]PWI15972.1 hypothetical protein DI272_18735 [Streptomyces sp. Act143]
MGDLMRAAPLGHSNPSHRVHGFCSLCHGRTVAEELAAWQVHEEARYEAAQHASTATPDGDDEDDEGGGPLIADVNSRTVDCPSCGRSDTVLDAGFTVTTPQGVHEVGRFAFCFGCETAQEVTSG